MNDIDTLLWGVRIAFWASLLFPIVVRFYWPWWKSWWGRNLVAFDLSVSLAILPQWLSVTFDIHVTQSPVWLWVEIVGIYLIILNVIWRAVMIWHTQRQGILKGKNGEEHDPVSRI